MNFGVNMLKTVIVCRARGRTLGPVFTAETQRSQSSEDLLIRTLSLRTRRLCGEISEFPLIPPRRSIKRACEG